MVTRVEIPGGMIAWARARSGVPADDLSRKFPRLQEWEQGLTAPTLKQLERYAVATYTPIGYFFLPEPPIEPVPLPDFRTVGDAGVKRPSPNLLDTIFDCQRRQEWYRDNARATGEDEVRVVGSMTTELDARTAAGSVRSELRFDVGRRGASWAEAFRQLAEHTEDVGVLVMVNGVVGSNTHRKLKVEEFRGFALVDSYAPVVFINGSDTKAAQIFTLAHEVAHILIGQSGLDDAELGDRAGDAVERWCNAFAAELLVPAERLERDHQRGDTSAADLDRLRIRTIMDDAATATGGNYYNTQQVRTGKRFTRRLIASTLEGQTLYRDAFQMLGFRRQSTFNELAQRLGVA